jgi:GTPase SAR1 family protein
MSLASILQQPTYRAVQVTLTGEGGVGKTSLAASFPAPVFLRTEDGMESLGANAPMAFPLAGSSQEIEEQLLMLGREDHDFRTVVIDSVSKLNILIEQEIVASDPKRPQSINQAMGGYGAGLAAVAERHRKIKALCDQLSQYKGLNIVFIAHADTETVDHPDQDPYTRYTLRMGKRSVTHYSDDVDIVAFIKMKTLTRGTGEKLKAITDGSRIITCYPTPNHISKNRYGITQDLPFNEGTNPLADYVPALQGTQPTEQPTQQQEVA